MFRGRNVLAVGAHPDDIEFGCFGTLLKFRKEIGELFCYILSWGGQGDSSSGFNREEESKYSFRSLYPFTMVTEQSSVIDPLLYHKYVALIEKEIDSRRINLVLAPTRHDTHQDHRLVHDIVVTALRESNASLLFYDPHCRTLDFRPSLFVDITMQIDQKIEALTNHESQNGKYYMQEEFIRDFHKTYMKPYCEAFEVGRIWISS